MHHISATFWPRCVRSIGVALSLVIIESTAIAETPEPSLDDVAVVDRLGEEAAQALFQSYEYDRSIPLEARIVEKREKSGVTREKVVFRGVQGFFVPGYLEYMTAGDDPRPCVLLLHGWSGSKDAWWQDDNYISGGNVRRALLEAGCAVLALDAQCHGDRIAQNDFAPVNHYAAEDDPQPRKGYFTQNEIYIQTTRDYRRAIDYLASRPDIDASRIGMLGYSMGGTQTYLLTGVEPRIKVSVAVAAPREKSKWSPIAPQNFVRGIGARPFLDIMGTQDSMCPVPHARGRQALIESPLTKQLFVEGEHRLPSDWVPDAVAWIMQHL
ncbi:MAG: alpha/beta fold hydrolase [Planctomycetaceae bacterium]|nr:alpha/beta fold hydrolase [Planctomycetaceae bacterium]